jgi:hypothetical protein
MTWHRADGAHPLDAGQPEAEPAAADRGTAERPVPARMGALRAVLIGARAVALAAGVAACILLLGTVVVAIVAEEIVPSDALDLLARGAMASLGILALIGVICEPLRVGAERALLLQDVRRGTSTPPAGERHALRLGPHGALLAAGVAGVIVGGICLPVGLLLAADDREALLARILVPSISAVLLAGGIALVRWSRKRGRGRERWQRSVSAAAARWRTTVPATPRAHRQRRHRVVAAASGTVGIGAMIFVGGVLLRQPGRFADPVTHGAVGEAAIDALLAMGALVMGVALAVILAVQGAMLAWTAIRDARTVRALERGERARLEHIDAVLLDDSALERAAMVLGVVGWLVAAYGWAPVLIGAIESAERTAAVLPATALALPGLAAVGLAWLLGALGALRLRARRARVLAVLARDPLPEQEQRGADRTAEALPDGAAAPSGA